MRSLREEIVSLKRSLTKMVGRDNVVDGPAFYGLSSLIETPEEKVNAIAEIAEAIIPESYEEAKELSAMLQFEAQLALMDSRFGILGLVTDEHDNPVGISYLPIGERKPGSLLEARRLALHQLPRRALNDLISSGTDQKPDHKFLL